MFFAFQLKVNLMSNGKDLNYQTSTNELEQDHDRNRKEKLDRYLAKNSKKCERVERQHQAHVYVQQKNNVVFGKK